MPRVSYRTIAPRATTLVETAEVLANAMLGKLNIGGSFTLQSNRQSVVLNDPRIGPQSVILLNATDLNGSNEIAQGWYVASLGNGTATLDFGRVTGADTVINYVVIG